MSALQKIASIIIILILSACSTELPDPVSEPPANQYIEKGRILTKGLAACGFCHGAEANSQSVLSGGREMEDAYGEVVVPNITPAESGIKDWDTMQIITLMRAGRRPDESMICTDWHAGFEWMADSDILAIISYLKNIPGVKTDIDKRSITMLDRNTLGFFEGTKEVTGHVPEIDKSYQIEYGQYLTDHVARCGVCHNTPASLTDDTVYLGGGKVISNSSGEKVAPNITQSVDDGIGGWSEEEILAYLQSGEIPGGGSVDSRFCPVEFYSNALPQDLVSLAKYLKSVNPQE